MIYSASVKLLGRIVYDVIFLEISYEVRSLPAPLLYRGSFFVFIRTG